MSIPLLARTAESEIVSQCVPSVAASSASGGSGSRLPPATINGEVSRVEATAGKASARMATITGAKAVADEPLAARASTA